MEKKVLFLGLVAVLVCVTCGIALAGAAQDAEYAYESLYKAGKYTDAINAFSKLLTDYPESEAANEANYWIAMSYYSLNKKDDALTYFAKQVEKAPTNRLTPEAVIWTGQIYLDKKLYDQALAEFNKVVSTYPDFALRAKCSVADCYRDQKKLSEAITSLTASISAAKAASVSKDDYYYKMMRIKLGELYRETENWDSGVTLYTALAEDYPDDAAGFKLDLATCYMGKKDYITAIATCKAVATAYPEMAREALLKVDDCLGEQGKHDERITHLNQLLEEHPEWKEDILFRRAVVRSDEKKEYPEAIADLEQLVADCPESHLVMHVKARIAGLTLHGLRDPVHARQLLLAFESQYPDYDQMAFIKGDLGTCAYREGSYAEAARLYEESMALPGPEGWHPFTLYMIGDCYARVDNKEKAKEFWGRLISEYPEDCWVPSAIRRMDRMDR